MPYLIFKLLHVVGIMCLFLALGLAIADTQGRWKKATAIIHGIALLFMLLTGFGMLGKPPAEQYWWVVKIFIWLGFGASLTLARKKFISPVAIGTAVTVLGLIAGYLGIFRPF